jgi:hypothetical protein
MRAIRYRAKKNSLSNTLTGEHIIAMWAKQNGKCAISGVPMTHSYDFDDESRFESNLSVDRIDSNKGYDPDNVQLVCSIVNYMKLDLVQANFVNWCKRISNFNIPYFFASTLNSSPPAAAAFSSRTMSTLLFGVWLSRSSSFFR